MKYDIAVGIDNPTLDTLVAQVYHALYPNLVKNSIDVGKYNISSITFDINAAPTVSLGPSAAANAYFETAIADTTHGEFANLDEDSKSTLFSLANAASFDLNIPSIVLTINYTSGAPSTLSGSATGAVNIQTTNQNGQNLLIAQILSATISIPSDPGMADILNRAFVPLLIPYLNENILRPFAIPQLQYKSLQVSMPVLVVQKPYVTAYSALGSTQPDIPTAFNWPTGCIYIGLDVAALEAATRIEFPLGPASSFNWNNTITGQVGAQVLAPNPILINSDGSLTATFTVKAMATLTWHTPNPFPNVSLGPSATSSLTATLQPSVNNGVLELGIKKATIPTFNFDWSGIPLGLSVIFGLMEPALDAALNAMIQALLAEGLTSIRLLSLPVISHDFGGTEIKIVINKATTSAQNSLLLISLQAAVS